MKIKALVMAVLFQVFVLASGFSAIAADKLPPAVLKAIAKYGTEADVTEYDQYEDEDGKTVYSITMDKDEVTYFLEVSATGQVLSEEKFSNEDAGDDVEESWD